MANFISRFLQPSPASQVKRVMRTVSTWKDISDAELKLKASVLRERARSGESKAALMTEAFACAVIAAERSIGLRPYDVQIRGGAALALGNVAEMKTGEGKTLAATMPAFLHSLYGKGVHIVTVNDYLAKRDAQWMGPVFEMLGAAVGCIQESMSDSGEDETKLRRAAYACDVTYVTNSECVFDYLRDNLAVSKDQIVHRGRYAAVLDEIDLLLIDEAQMPLIISGPAEDNISVVRCVDRAVRRLQALRDFEVDHRYHSATLTDLGQTAVESMLGVGKLEDPSNAAWAHAVYQALQAYGVHERDVDYMVRNGEVHIIDDYTGRASPEKRYSNGLHQALEAKERLAIRGENLTLSKTSYQHYFRSYEHLSGMTGTAWSVRRELEGVYGLQVVRIPTAKPMIRDDYKKVLFRTAKEKRAAVVHTVRAANEKGRPVLIGTLSVEESQAISKLLSQAAVPHQVLNAKHHAKEAEIVAQAGRLGAVTVSTNMAGRGTDILLGGDPVGLARREALRSSADFSTILRDQERLCTMEREKVIDVGGLLVIGTGEHDAERIDDQLRGRAGRQGDPGASTLYISLEDPLYKKFGENKILPFLLQRSEGHPDDVPIQDAVVKKALDDIRQNVEMTAAAVRKDVLRFDSVLNERREAIWAWRRSLLMTESAGDWYGSVDEMIDDLIDRIAEESFADAESQAEPMYREDVWNRVYERITRNVSASSNADTSIDNREGVGGVLRSLYRGRRSGTGHGRLTEWDRLALLNIIDVYWPQYLNELESVEQEVHLRAYAQVDPFVAFRTEAARMFGKLMIDIELAALRTWLSVQLPDTAATAVAATKAREARKMPSPIRSSSRKDKQRKQRKRRVPKQAAAPA